MNCLQSDKLWDVAVYYSTGAVTTAMMDAVLYSAIAYPDTGNTGECESIISALEGPVVSIVVGSATLHILSMAGFVCAEKTKRFLSEKTWRVLMMGSLGSLHSTIMSSMLLANKLPSGETMKCAEIVSSVIFTNTVTITATASLALTSYIGKAYAAYSRQPEGDDQTGESLLQV